MTTAADTDVGLLPQQPRTYMITSGRTRTTRHLRLESQLQAGAAPADLGAMSVEALHAVELCERSHSVSVAEISAGIGRPVWVTRLLLEELLDIGVLTAPAPIRDGIDVDLLQRIAEGLRCLV